MKPSFLKLLRQFLQKETDKFDADALETMLLDMPDGGCPVMHCRSSETHTLVIIDKEKALKHLNKESLGTRVAELVFKE